jgi:hypothetical protein
MPWCHSIHRKQVHEEFLRLTVVDDSQEHHSLVVVCLLEWGYADVVMLSVIMLSFIMLNVVAPQYLWDFPSSVPPIRSNPSYDFGISVVGS